MVSFCVLWLTRWSKLNETFVRVRMGYNYSLLKFSALWDMYSAHSQQNRLLTANFDRLENEIEKINRVEP